MPQEDGGKRKEGKEQKEGRRGKRNKKEIRKKKKKEGILNPSNGVLANCLLLLSTRN